jgi:hypothetical protein
MTRNRRRQILQAASGTYGGYLVGKADCLEIAQLDGLLWRIPGKVGRYTLSPQGRAELARLQVEVAA